MTAASAASATAAPGMNVDGRLRASPEVVQAAGARWVRLVLLPDADTREIAALHHRYALKVLGVVARESVSSFGPADARSTWDTAAQHYRARVGTAAAHEYVLDAVQCGNEADHTSPSSWTLPAARVNELARAFWGFRSRIGPGLASGQPEYCAGLDVSLFDALAVHPYGRAPTRTWPYFGFGYVGDLLERYRAYHHTLWVTEYGTDKADAGMPREEYQARYVGAMARTLSDQPGVAAQFHFCWSDRDGVAPFGLLDTDNRPKPALAAWTAAVAESPPPVGGGGGSMPTFNVSAPLLEKMKAKGDVPLSDEVYDPVYNNSECAGRKYLWKYNHKSNITYTMPAWDLPLA